VVETLYARGDQLRTGISRVIAELHLQDHFTLAGRSCCLLYGTLDEQKRPSQAFRTLFLQESIRRGILAPSFAVSYSHTPADIDRTVEAVGEALRVYRQALDHGIEGYLVGRPVKPVFRPYP
jgi:glutamate-1-semialdehyde 2,1-aminomutase